MITREQLLNTYIYDGDTGAFVRRVSAGRAKKGDVVFGTPNSKGYLRLSIGSKLYYAHKLAILATDGELPAVVDHINGDIRDNRRLNLRACSASENAENRRQKVGKAGYPGVTRATSNMLKPWQSQIVKAGKTYFLGYFTTREEAYAAYKAHKLILHAINPISDELVRPP